MNHFEFPLILKILYFLISLFLILNIIPYKPFHLQDFRKMIKTLNFILKKYWRISTTT